MAITSTITIPSTPTNTRADYGLLRRPRVTITFLCPLPKDPVFDCMAHRRSGMLGWWWTSGSLAQHKLSRAFRCSVAGNDTEGSIMMDLPVILGTG
jgi:hypothetical protein